MHACPSASSAVNIIMASCRIPSGCCARAATTLAKHWRDEDKCLEAYSLLQPVYGWFVEGFDTTPLKDAKALLGELRDLSDTQTQARMG